MAIREFSASKDSPEQNFWLYEVLIDSDDRPRLLDYLGSSYRQRFSHSGDVKDLDMALKHTLEAVAPESTPLAPADRSIFFNA